MFEALRSELTSPPPLARSLLASHAVLGLPIVDRLGANRLEPVTITAAAFGNSTGGQQMLDYTGAGDGRDS